jgi:amino acid adenylation domain-containing protein
MTDITDSTEAEFDPFAGPALLATVPSTEPQREIWTATHIGDDASLAFNESFSLFFAGPLALPELIAATGDLLARHEALRSTFSADGLTLCISEPYTPEAPLEDWLAHSPAEREERWQRLLALAVETPFDLTRGPLFRATFVRFAPDEHRVLFCAHHIVCDGWSTAVMCRDLAALYNARRRGTQDLPRPDSFAAYARAEAAPDPVATRAHEAFWLSRFKGEIPVLDLPCDRQRPALKTYPARREDVTLDRELVSEVRRAGAKAKASLFATLLGGFVALLHRLTGLEDIVVGIPAAGQSIGGHDQLVGHCVNTLPLRSSVHLTQPFTELLAQVRSAMLDAYEHQEYTFGTLLKKLPLQRDPSRPPLVAVAFNVERGMTNESMGFEGVTARCLVNPRHYENFEIFINAVELDGEVQLQCQYNTDLFDRATIQRWLAAYRVMLANFVAEPACEVGRLRVMDDAELRRIVFDWNAAADEASVSECTHRLFREQVRLTPDASALLFEGGRLSYSELEARSNQAARRLLDLGVTPNDRVGLCLERTPELIISLLGILKAGGAYLPIEPNYPSARMEFMLEDAAPKAIITQSALKPKLPAYSGPFIVVDDEKDLLAALSPEPVDSGVTPEDMAYVLYTSGSTGKPKGVEVPHRAIDRLVKNAPFAHLGRDTVMLQAAPVAFDASTFEIWGALLNGGSLVLHAEQVPSARGLGRAIEQFGVTTMWLTAALFNAVVDEDAKQLAGLKEILSGGEALSVPHVRRALEAMPNTQVINGYGPTETTTFATCYRIPRPLASEVQAIPIGRPIRQTRLYVLDANRNPVLQGVIGELYIGGKGVARQYLARPELTAERFVPDPFRAGEKLYRTGDLVRFRPDGVLEFFGRADQQVKIRGFRIELGEIEETILRHPAVQKVAVTLRQDRPGDKRLVAYTVAEPGQPASEEELREHVKKSLPEYMIPSNFVALDAMPLTASGKVDRKALPAPKTGASDEEFVAPRTPMETIIAELWKEALHLARVSVHDDFFALGGHSLLASQILGRLRRDHGVNLSFRKIFEAPTVARLAEAIEGSAGGGVGQKEKPIAVRAAGTKVPLSTVQERHWLLEELQPAQRLVHSVRGTWQLDGELDSEVFQRALDEIIRRHEMLRLVVEKEGGELTQHFAPSADFRIRHVDLRHLPEAEREAESVREIEALHQQPFDLTVGPLFRSTLFRISDTRYHYFTLRHSMVWDGWSYDIFLKELCALYADMKAGRALSLAPLPIGYGDFALWYRDWQNGPELERQVNWWRQHLGSDPPDARMPLDLARPPRMTHEGANERSTLTKADSDALTALARDAGATLFTALFAAYIALLQRYTQQREMVVGTPVRGRNRPEVENLIGNFVNTLALRVKAEPDQTFQSLIAAVRDLTLDAFSNQEMPLEKLGDRPPVLNVLFSFQDARERPRAAGDLTVTQLYRPLPVAGNDMMLWVMDYGDYLLAVLNYSTEVFKPATISKFLARYVSFLRQVVKNPQIKLSELELSDDEERAALPNLGRPIPAEAANDWAHAELERRASATPEAEAFVYQNETLSFREVSDRANRIAAKLQAMGVGPGQRVAVVLPRSADLVAAAYGVWKSGAALALLDGTHPSARNARLLGAAKPDALLTYSTLPALTPSARSVLNLDQERDAIDGQRSENLARPAADPSRSAALLVLGFGEDGAPQCRPLTHAELSSTASGLAAQLGSEKALVYASMVPAGELSALELVIGVSAGVPTLVAGEDALDPSRLIAAIGQRALKAVVTDAESWGQLLLAEPTALPNLRAIVTGTPSPTLLDALLPRVREVWRWTLGADAGLTAFVHRVESGLDLRVIGRPVGSTRAAVLDDRRALAPVAIYGELLLGNAAHPDFDGEGFGPTPDGALDAKLRASGLRARWTQLGELQLRHPDETRTSQGARIRPQEIAASLARHAAVRRAAVVPYEVGVGDRRLVAYFEPNPEASFTETEFRRLLRQELPESLVPKTFVELAKLPLNADGGVDLGSLPSPFAAARREDYVAARTDNERLLAELWQEALKVPRVSVYDNFFDLGGHSLLCFKVIARVEEKTGKRLSPRLMLLNSLEQVAASLSDSPAAPPLEAAPAAPVDNSLGSRMRRKLGELLKR